MKSFLTVLFLVTMTSAFANTIVVGKDKTVSTLRQAVQLAKDGDTILLNKGVYKEGNITIAKPIYLIGVGQPVLDGELKNELLTLTGKQYCGQGYSFCQCRLFILQ